MGNAFPHLLPDIFKKLAAGQVIDTGIRERLLLLSTQGNLEYLTLPDGSQVKIKGLSLNNLSTKYLGKDRTEEKKAADAWRLHYNVLWDTPSTDWPEDALRYAIEDAEDALLISEAQDLAIRPAGFSSANTQEIQAAADFALFLMTCWGVRVDPEEYRRMRDWLAEELKPERLATLISSGILVRAQAPRPAHGAGPKPVWNLDGLNREQVQALISKACACWNVEPERTAGGAVSTSKAACEAAFQACVEAGALTTTIAEDKACFFDFFERRDMAPPENPRIVQPKPEKINQKELRALVEKLCLDAGYPVKRSKETGEASLKREYLEEVAHLSPIIEEYLHRGKLQKLVTTELPRMCERDSDGNPTDQVAAVVHPVYNILVQSFRTSSYATEAYPSVNGQNIDPRARGCYTAREGMLFLATDYSAVELVSLGNKLKELFGRSVLADLINSGVDPHAYLGAQLAYALDGTFRDVCVSCGASDQMGIYKAFVLCKDDPREGVSDFFYHYRTFAKPTGLGYPGGLGAKTFVAYSKATFGLNVTIEQAKLFKSIWLQTFPEMKLYFDWITSHCKDPANPIIGQVEREDGTFRNIEGYAYTVPGAGYRAGCAYTEACNGAALQSPTAIGAKLAVFNVSRACYDETQGSVLFGSRPIFFIHDEIVTEIPDDHLAHERAEEQARLMTEPMQSIMTHVRVSTESTLMRRWNKKAKPVLDRHGRLTVWEPKETD